MQSQKEYQKWIKIFYNGNMLVKGWKHRKKEILDLLNDNQEKAGLLLDTLGEQIATEWALENQVRKINNSDLLSWGERMKKAAMISSDSILETLVNIMQEIEARVSTESS